MSATDSLLGEAKRAVVDWGGTVRRSYGDGHGQYAFRYTHRGETFIAVSKESAHQGQASFEQGVVERAADQYVHLVEFFGADPALGSAYVFNPETVREDGEESIGSSKKGVHTEWYQLPLERGVLLGDYLSGRAQPPKPQADDESSRPVKITDY